MVCKTIRLCYVIQELCFESVRGLGKADCLSLRSFSFLSFYSSFFFLLFPFLTSASNSVVARDSSLGKKKEPRRRKMLRLLANQENTAAIKRSFFFFLDFASSTYLFFPSTRCKGFFSANIECKNAFLTSFCAYLDQGQT